MHWQRPNIEYKHKTWSDHVQSGYPISRMNLPFIFRSSFPRTICICVRCLLLTSLCEDKRTAPQTIPSKQSNRHRSFFFLTLKGLGQSCSRKSKGYVGAPLTSEKMSDMAPRVARMIVAYILGPVLEL